MRRSWAERGAVVLLTAVGIGACGGSGGSGGSGTPSEETPPAAQERAPVARVQPARPPSDTEQLEALLADRSAVLARGDARLYAATATGGQRVRDRRAARRIRGLGIRDVELSMAGLDVGVRRARLRVRTHYRVRGVSGRYAAARTLRAVKTSRGWRVAREMGARERQPWELGRFVRSRSRHFVVLAPAGLDLDGLTAALESSHSALGDTLPASRLRRRSLVVVARDAAQLRRLTRGIRGVESLAAITDSSVREDGAARRPAEVVSQRVLVSWPVFRALDPATRKRILTHELTHAALAEVTSGRTPAWLVEGVALWASGDRRVGEAAAELDAVAPASLARLAAPDGIARSSGSRQSAAYAYASAAGHYLAGRFGEDGLLDVYEAFNDESLPGAAGDPRTTDRALRRAVGISRRAFERDLRAWIAADGKG